MLFTVASALSKRESVPVCVCSNVRGNVWVKEEGERESECDLNSRSLARPWQDHISRPIGDFHPFFSSGVERQNNCDISSSCYACHLSDLCPFPWISPECVGCVFMFVYVCVGRSYLYLIAENFAMCLKLASLSKVCRRQQRACHGSGSGCQVIGRCRGYGVTSTRHSAHRT